MGLNKDLVVGVVADTHIPDRALELHPQLIPVLRQAGVDLVLHAGDISSGRGLAVLEQLGEVLAVRGNRDLFFNPPLPMVRRLELNGAVVALMHGHGGWLNYLRDKMIYLQDGYQLERYAAKLLTVIPDADVVVYGHTHRAENLVMNGKLLFNPGSANFGPGRKGSPSVGVLRISQTGQVSGEIILLKGFRLVKGRWKNELQSDS